MSGINRTSGVEFPDSLCVVVHRFSGRQSCLVQIVSAKTASKMTALLVRKLSRILGCVPPEPK